MKRTVSLFILILLFNAPALAQEEVEKITAQIPSESAAALSIEQQKEELFLQYQKDKDELAKKYDAAVNKIAEETPEDLGRQKMLLEKEYKEEQKKRLAEYRTQNLALEKHRADQRGYTAQFDPESEARQRLEKNRHLAPIVDNREKVIKRGPRGYVKKSQRSQNERTSKSYGYMTKDKVETMRNKGKANTTGPRSH